jgi:hypothetical protein
MSERMYFVEELCDSIQADFSLDKSSDMPKDDVKLVTKHVKYCHRREDSGSCGVCIRIRQRHCDVPNL